MDFDSTLPRVFFRNAEYVQLRTVRDTIGLYLDVRKIEAYGGRQVSAIPGPGREPHPYEEEHRIDIIA